MIMNPRNSLSVVLPLLNVQILTIQERLRGQAIEKERELVLHGDTETLQIDVQISTGSSHIKLTDRYDWIALETLNINGMKSLWGRKVSDLGFAEFVAKLKYIAAKKGVKIVFIDKWYPSSKTCHVCGEVNQDLNLRDRTWQCPNCQTQLDRDRNAAVNIHRVGHQPLQKKL